MRHRPTRRQVVVGMATAFAAEVTTGGMASDREGPTMTPLENPAGKYPKLFESKPQA